MNDVNPIVLFDGTCGFCDKSVRWFIRRDKAARLRFAPLQSELGQSLLKKHGLPADYDKSLVLIEGERASTSSTGTFRIISYLSWPWKAVSGLRIIPRFIRDAGYRFIANHRHTIAGSPDACPMPTAEERARFIDQMPVSSAN
jgi:predicted DCC family thiol-disulfide oxidoreductase YuxK